MQQNNHKNLTMILMRFARVVLMLATLVASADVETERRLQDVPFDSLKEECKIGETDDGDNIYGPCDPSVHFPTCTDGQEFTCFNRHNRRDKFYDDKQPYYYIDPRRVQCYPLSWITGDGGCSSCTPGRYCKSEGRCILDEMTYECQEWL